MTKHYLHPDLENIFLPGVMQALSDPVRLGIIQQLIQSEPGTEFACNDFPMNLAKATRSHHFQILREAGLIRTRVEGTKCMNSLRHVEIDSHFPGLLDFIRKNTSMASLLLESQESGNWHQTKRE